MNTSVNSLKLSIDGKTYQSDDPVLTGQQLLDLAGRRPADQFLVYQLLVNGQLEDIRPDETVDLRQSGLESFFTVESDRSFRFTIDNRKFEWPMQV